MNNDTAIMADITLRNFGATPGYDFKSWTNIRIGNSGEPIFGQRKSPAQTSIIGPLSNISAPSQFIPISPEERSAINNGIMNIFIWVEAREMPMEPPVLRAALIKAETWSVLSG
jgi:hypothetical protein